MIEGWINIDGGLEAEQMKPKRGRPKGSLDQSPRRKKGDPKLDRAAASVVVCQSAAPMDASQRALLAQYADAFERFDVERLVNLLLCGVKLFGIDAAGLRRFIELRDGDKLVFRYENFRLKFRRD